MRPDRTTAQNRAARCHGCGRSHALWCPARPRRPASPDRWDDSRPGRADSRALQGGCSVGHWHHGRRPRHRGPGLPLQAARESAAPSRGFRHCPLRRPTTTMTPVNRAAGSCDWRRCRERHRPLRHTGSRPFSPARTRAYRGRSQWRSEVLPAAAAWQGRRPHRRRPAPGGRASRGRSARHPRSCCG